MRLAMIGLGRMGANMVRRLARDGHELVVYDVDDTAANNLDGEMDKVTATGSLTGVINELPSPRVIWMMVPHEYVDDTIAKLRDGGLSSGDILIDGGNSNFNLTIARAERLAEDGIEYVDCGTSGGVWGLENGYSLMVGGSDHAIAAVAPVLKSLAPAEDLGWGHVGPVGAGHYVKMVHNGIEYGMMQAYAEGFDLMSSKDGFDLDMHQIAQIWQHGSVVRSWLLDLTTDALAQDPSLAALSDWVDDSGEGRWTVQDSLDQGIPTPVLTLALQMRFASRQNPSYAGRLLNAMRAGFGGHSIKRANGNQ